MRTIIDNLFIFSLGFLIFTVILAWVGKSDRERKKRNRDKKKTNNKLHL